ncbi:unnamed protein product, partial [Rotaria sp. Silwood2]
MNNPSALPPSYDPNKNFQPICRQ